MVASTEAAKILVVADWLVLGSLGMKGTRSGFGSWDVDGLIAVLDGITLGIIVLNQIHGRPVEQGPTFDRSNSSTFVA